MITFAAEALATTTQPAIGPSRGGRRDLARRRRKALGATRQRPGVAAAHDDDGGGDGGSGKDAGSRRAHSHPHAHLPCTPAANPQLMQRARQRFARLVYLSPSVSCCFAHSTSSLMVSAV